MKTVWKFPLEVGLNYLQIPKGAHSLHVDLQQRQIMLWCEVDSDAPVETMRVVAVPTGGGVPYESQFLGTVIMPGGNFVWHFYSMSEET